MNLREYAILFKRIKEKYRRVISNLVVFSRLALKKVVVDQYKKSSILNYLIFATIKRQILMLYTVQFLLDRSACFAAKSRLGMGDMIF